MSPRLLLLATALASAGAFCYGYHVTIVDEAAERLARLHHENVTLQSIVDEQSTTLQSLRTSLHECRTGQKINPKPQGMYQPHLRRTIRAVLHHLHVPSPKDWERLLLLTVVTESDCGAFTRQLSGPARGITQMEPATEKWVLSTLKHHKPQLYAAIRALRVPANLGIHEAEYNLAYSVALTYGVYFLRHADPSHKTTAQLVKIYKDKYNTRAGKATPEKVMQKLTAYALHNL